MYGKNRSKDLCVPLIGGLNMVVDIIDQVQDDYEQYLFRQFPRKSEGGRDLSKADVGQMRFWKK